VTGDRRPAPQEQLSAPDPAVERPLIDRACKGDRRAIESLYEIHVDRIYKYVLFRVGHQDDAEDITGEVFVKMVEHLPRYQWRNVPFQAWLFMIAKNQIITYYRRSSARPSRPIDDLDFADPQSDPDALVERQLTVSEIYKAAQKLPEAQRRVIELRFGADLSVRETAQMLNKTENNAKVLQHGVAETEKLLKGSS
jgi:RNA polymerase sigma-70 factor (ECF subfamily)